LIADRARQEHGQKGHRDPGRPVRAAGLAALVFLALKAANLTSFGGGDTYPLRPASTTSAA
jgi:hypothetical protein